MSLVQYYYILKYRHIPYFKFTTQQFRFDGITEGTFYRSWQELVYLQLHYSTTGIINILYLLQCQCIDITLNFLNYKNLALTK